MNLTLSIDDQLLAKARKRASEMGTTVNQMVRDYLGNVAGENDLETQIEWFKRTSGQGNPDPDWKWNREEIYEERFAHYGKP
jgi:hypothetical protein